MAEKCPECGAWWAWPSEHHCPPVVASTGTMIFTVDRPYAKSAALIRCRVMHGSDDAACLDCLAYYGIDCPCGCSREMHIGEIGCPCGMPDEPPCTLAAPASSSPEPTSDESS